MEKEKTNGKKGAPAGLAFAPPYDPSNDLDPSKAVAVSTEGFDVHKLAYYQELERQRSFKTRVLLVGLVLVLILANMWMVQSNRASMSDANAQINEQLNQATSDRSVIVDQLELGDVRTQLADIATRLERIETSLETLGQ